IVTTVRSFEMQPESDDGFKRWIMAGGGNISDMGRAEDNAVYNSRIAGMLNRSFSQLISLLPLVLILLISSSSRVYAQNWATAEEQLARICLGCGDSPGCE